MEILTIIPGSYSIKFHQYTIEDSKVEIKHQEEITLLSIQDEISQDPSDEEIQNFIISSYLQKRGSKEKYISILPSKYLTSRFLLFPITQRKKIIPMIPFQLEETIPFNLSDIVYNSTFKKKNKRTRVLVNIAKKNQFTDFYVDLQTHNIIPAILTTELSIINNYIEEIELITPYCILDLGHKATKAYFVNNEQIISNHSSNIAGFMLDQVIASTYQLSLVKASEYKHLQSYFLLAEQYELVDQDQKDFALLMASTFQELLDELKRWEIGFTAQEKCKIQNIFLMGGTSNIKNIDQFIMHATGAHVGYVDIQKFTKKYFQHPLPPETLRPFTKNLMIASSQIESKLLINFLQGNYLSKFNNNLSIHSTVFIFTRILLLAIIICFYFIFEKQMYLNRENKLLNKKLKTMLAKEELQIKKIYRKKLKTSPSILLEIIDKKNKILSEEFDSLSSIDSRDAFSFLVYLNYSIPVNPNISLSEYISDGREFSATFYSTVKGELDKFKDFMSTQNYKIKTMKMLKEKNELQIIFLNL